MPKPESAGEGYSWFTARIRSDLQERFLNRFPQKGSNVWWLNTMMERFLDQVEKYPGIADLMQDSITSFLEDPGQ